jgi:predicted regulator of Ras-like GTPase activity (Roadblock/LC7/MglB family)
MTIPGKSSYQCLLDIITDLNHRGNFSATVLTDPMGFPIAASAGEDEDVETQAAVVAQIQKIITQVKKQLGMGITDEVSMNDVSGKRLVCRSFSMNGTEFILAVLLSGRDRPYRRLTTRAISSIQKTIPDIT